MNAVDKPCPPCPPESRHPVCSPNSLHSQDGAGAPTPRDLYQEHFTRALELLRSGDQTAAAQQFVLAACASPQRWCDNALEISKKDPELGLKCLFEVLTLEAPALVHAGAWCNIGNIYANAGQNDAAMDAFKKSWDHYATPDAAANRALIHLWRNELPDATRWIERALLMNPWLNDAQFTQATIELMRGNYRRGFQLYECRWRSKTNSLRKLPAPKPEWEGPERSSFFGKDSHQGRILIYGEQGSGDSILMLRYARLLKAAGMWQCWVLQKGLKPLAETLGVIDQICYPGDEPPEYDCHLPAASLPRVFGTTLETVPPAPYIPKPPHGPFLERRGIHVGIAWRGSIVQGNDRFRSVSLKEFEPVFAVPGVTFHSLQVENSTESLLYPDLQTYDPPADWLETARRVASLDLVISVDTSIVHLCGAMGVPCWCALHCRPYFVYPLCRPDSPWYPSVRLFKQQRELEWKPVFERIADELRKTVSVAVR